LHLVGILFPHTQVLCLIYLQADPSEIGMRYVSGKLRVKNIYVWP